MVDTVFKDLNHMHSKFQQKQVVENMDKETLLEFLKFRASMIQEELDELNTAIENMDLENIVDSLIDGIVFSVGTLDLFKVDGQKAWDEVMRSNLKKKTGVKAERPNKWGFPDLVKPEGWEAPSHKFNYGLLEKLR